MGPLQPHGCLSTETIFTMLVLEQESLRLRGSEEEGRGEIRVPGHAHTGWGSPIQGTTGEPVQNVVKTCPQHPQSQSLPLARGACLSDSAPSLPGPPPFPMLSHWVLWECLFAPNQIRSSWEQDSRHKYVSIPSNIAEGETCKAWIHK